MGELNSRHILPPMTTLEAHSLNGTAMRDPQWHLNPRARRLPTYYAQEVRHGGPILQNHQDHRLQAVVVGGVWE